MGLLNIHPKLLNSYRLIIVKKLSKTKRIRHVEIKDFLGLSDGSVQSHLKALMKNGFVKQHKSIVKNKFMTEYSLTNKGILALSVARLEMLRFFRNE